MTQRSLFDSAPARAVRAMTPAQRAALPRRRQLTFVGRPWVDLLMSGGDDWLAVWETLHEPADLDRWLAASPLAVARPDGRPLADAADLAAARALRARLWALAEAVFAGDLPEPAVVEAVNAAAAVAPLAPRVDPRTGARAWRRPTVAAALSEIARDALDLLADREQWGRLRVCASDDCGMVFYDASRPGRRRWCSTERCGDRQRARSYRARRRAG